MTRSITCALRDASLFALVLNLVACATSPDPKEKPGSKVPDNVYATYGVHNSAHANECATADCTYQRKPGEPTNPTFPPYWSSNWTMYRVFNNYAKNPPPYDGKPPPPLVEGQDYEASQGATYYDSTWQGERGQGAMMEYYEKRCLPIFPISNHYTCAFISLGKTAYFVTYPEDRPKGMPPVCLFSPDNHPPGLDFIKHLPYAAADGERLGGKVQGYSFWVDHATGKPIQVGVSPDRTEDGAIMFGYAFESTPRPDSVEKTLAPYRHPQSFYFSGVPIDPPNAPIVTQIYTDFAMAKPDPAKTWAQVSGLDPATLPECQLFDPPSNGQLMLKSGKPVPTWGTIGRGR
jgi:hypothetical protein